MKNRFPLRRVLCLAIALLSVLTLMVACTGKPDDGDQNPGEGEQIDLTGYTLIRADIASKALKKAFVNIHNVIADLCNVELAVGTDYVDEYVNNRAEYEIIVGHTRGKCSVPDTVRGRVYHRSGGH